VILDSLFSFCCAEDLELLTRHNVRSNVRSNVRCSLEALGHDEEP
jgi:hypothetical protein